ncbi:MAG: glutamine--fructose-6-phosphate transaminase (isomerizing) [Gammaproteobacteria bacterium]|nr:MAG: glutamine--fructose-6-phosphate transaminase (isomerizing) [Gammaproteobacteria bacterium]UTW42918.1 glutamine--fructose-6-phosphate transaminase (isomerizing) [bacterium SCSIO 12844]
MCGIVGAVAERNVVPILLEGLKRLEYRGYDSAGIAMIDNKNQLNRTREVGKVKLLAERIKNENFLKGSIGIAHTRWATHGGVTLENAHPHQGNHISIVHNGIIENHGLLREELQQSGVKFSSETDSEVIAHLAEKIWHDQIEPQDVALELTEKLEGAYGAVIMNAHYPDTLIAIRSGSPMVIGLGIGENFIASDTFSLLPVTRKFAYMDEGDIAIIKREAVKLYDALGNEKSLLTEVVEQQDEGVSKQGYKHFMQKEMFEQPDAVARTLGNCFSLENQVLVERFGVNAESLFHKLKHIRIVACGSSYIAGLVAKYWIESIANVACDVEIASEIRYRKTVVPDKCLFVTISQSGETADTMAALRQAKELDYLGYLAICNVPSSSLVRESDLVFMTQAGVEIGVASTKALTTQMASLLLLTCAVGKFHGLNKEDEQQIVKSLQHLPLQIKEVLALDHSIEALASHFIDKHHTLFLGRGIHYPIAMEGALKLKEISYIHAEAYPAGELKHGPLALVDKDMPVIAVAPNDRLLEKLESNLMEVQARGGELFVFVDHEVKNELKLDQAHMITLASIDAIIAPIVMTIPLQLLSYHVAVQRGTDVDQPRNLAKSVTVE